MGIHQLSVSHDECEDRLLLRVGTHESQEYRFWLTRRMVHRLLPELEKALRQSALHVPGVVAQDAHSRQMVSDFQRERFLQLADFQTPYVPRDQDLPLGEHPMLLTEIHITPQPQGDSLLVLQDSRPGGLSCQLQLPSSLLHGLVHLIRQTLERLDWALANVTEPTHAPGPESATHVPYPH